MTEKTRIRIEGAGDKPPAHTKVFDENGVELTCIERIVIDLDVQKPEGEGTMGATVYAIEAFGTLQPEVEDIRVKVLPPPPPKTKYRLSIDSPEAILREAHLKSAYRLEKHTPLPAYGENVETMATGFMEPIGPLELIFEEAE